MEKKETPQERYNKKNLISVTFRFSKKYDADIIEKLGKQENKTGYLKDLIRKDIEN